jgi:hypothetical protein
LVREGAEKRITFRKFADMIGGLSMYLSQVSLGHCDPPAIAAFSDR